MTKKAAAAYVAKRTTRYLFCPLTDAERIERGTSLAMEHDELDKIEEEKSEAMREFKERLDDKSSRIAKLALIVRNRREERSVDCEERSYFSENRVETVRLDTGEVVTERAMTPEERQLELHAPEGEGAPA